MTHTNPGQNVARRRRHTVVVAVCAALIVVGGGAVTWAATQQVEAPPAPPAASSTTQEESSASSTAPQDAATQPSASAPSTPKAAAESSSPAPGVQPLSASPPVAVRIPGIDVESPIHGLGLDAEGKLQVPTGERYNEVAWYDGSPTPGEVGPAVLEGHVTGTGYAPSVFFELGDTRKGDLIEVDRADGTTATFEVTEVKSTPKDDFPRIDVYGATDGPELRVITCGGTFDKNAGRHLDNVIVFAKLIKG
ncbi:LPXTG-site transpeptidase (sortase) family protein [Promicromonospora umidemergens]|uniref:Sortase family protein n=1 Tax=Promicromonospora umidemergens TaxID=629679 RepID=A0ABP8XMY3_9MICO|nr:class F sortase [Promicromonospora umidemergens]MCP2282082.1 LPXTG-site transpeptidase (sortase) family protein [Promicromonospora umidemergens]